MFSKSKTKPNTPRWVDRSPQYRVTLDLSLHGVFTIIAALESVKYDGIEDTTELVRIIQKQVDNASTSAGNI